jgi:hypothetical protein
LLVVSLGGVTLVLMAAAFLGRNETVIATLGLWLVAFVEAVHTPALHAHRPGGHPGSVDGTTPPIPDTWGTAVAPDSQPHPGARDRQAGGCGVRGL